MAADDGYYGPPEQSGPARNAETVTPSDTLDLPDVTRGLYVGGSGDVKVNMADTGAAVVFVLVPAGTLLPVRVSRVLATGTTATDMVALW